MQLPYSIIISNPVNGLTSGQDARTTKTSEFTVVGASRSLLLVSIPLRLWATRGLTAAILLQ